MPEATASPRETLVPACCNLIAEGIPDILAPQCLAPNAAGLADVNFRCRTQDTKEKAKAAA